MIMRFMQVGGYGFGMFLNPVVANALDKCHSDPEQRVDGRVVYEMHSESHKKVYQNVMSPNIIANLQWMSEIKSKIVYDNVLELERRRIIEGVV